MVGLGATVGLSGLGAAGLVGLGATEWAVLGTAVRPGLGTAERPGLGTTVLSNVGAAGLPDLGAAGLAGLSTAALSGLGASGLSGLATTGLFRLGITGLDGLAATGLIGLDATGLSIRGRGNHLGPRFVAWSVAGVILRGLGTAGPVDIVEDGPWRGSLGTSVLSGVVLGMDSMGGLVEAHTAGLVLWLPWRRVIHLIFKKRAVINTSLCRSQPMHLSEDWGHRWLPSFGWCSGPYFPHFFWLRKYRP